MPFRLLNKIRSSLSAKIALIVSVPVVCIIPFFSYFNYIHDREGIFHDAESRLLYMGEDMKSPAETFMREKKVTALDQLVYRTALGADVNFIVLIDNHGQVIACNKKQWKGKQFREMLSVDISANDVHAFLKALSGGYSVYYDPEDKQYCLVIPLSSGRVTIGAALISLDLQTTQAEIKKRAVELLVISFMVSAAIGVSIYFLLYYWFTRRVQSVSTAAVRLSSGDLNARAEAGGSDEIAGLATSFNLMAEEITNWRSNLEEMAASRVRELSALYDVVETISQSLDLGRVLPKVLDRVLDSLRADKGAVVLVEPDGKLLQLAAQRGLSEEGIRQISTLGQGCIGDVILRNNAIHAGGDEDGGSDFVPGLEQDEIRSALVVPISARGEVLGALALYSAKKERFSDQDEALLMTIGNQVGVAVENAHLYEKTLELAQRDGLTGLANRRYLMERLKQEMDRSERYQTSLSVIMMDLDKFKSFNDTYGHIKGDELLRTFSALVMGMIRTSDVAGRYGGEEFCVVLPNTSIKGALVIAERIRRSAEELMIPISEDQPPANRTVSIGISEFTAGESIEKLLSIADSALYRAKEGGRNRVVG